MSEPEQDTETPDSSGSGGGGGGEFIIVEHTADPNGPPAPDAQLTAVDRLVIFRIALAEFSLRVERITATDWDRPTPCPDWTVADLLRHMIDEHRWAPPLLRGDDLDAAGEQVAEVSADEDLIGAWLAAAAESSDAFSRDGVLDGQVALSRGSTPTTEYLAEMTADLAVHGWDLARGLGQDGQLPDSVARPVWEWFTESGDLSGSGMFGPPLPVDSDASYSDRLIGLSGRDRYWSSSPA